MRKQWTLLLAGVATILVGALIAWMTQTTDGIRIRDVRFTGANGTQMSALLYIPKNATSKTPAPGILAVHGYINSRETQSGFAIEYARRGYVVLALDQTGHGYSAPPAFANGYGGPDGLKYLRSLDVVDVNNIGLEGHSMGGWTVLAAAKVIPDGYKSMVLEGSSTGTKFAPEGSTSYPRNLALVFSKYDEFSKLMWEVDKGADVGQSPKLWKVFGTTGPVEAGKVYGDPAAGTARVLYAPAVTHPGDHLSREAIGYSLDWFGKTLQGGTPKAADDQIWYWKEFGTLIALVGFVVFLLGTFEALLALPYFEGQKQAAMPTQKSRDGKWWLRMVLMMAVPVLSFFPFFKWGAGLLPASSVFPQSITNQVLVWALLNAVITLALSPVLSKGALNFKNFWGKSIAISILSVLAGYASLAVVDAIFQVDYRFWIVAVKLMSPVQFKYFLVYLLPFTAFFVVALRALHAGISVAGDSVGKLYASNICAMAGGFLVFLGAEYLWLWMTGMLLTPTEPLNTIVAIQFLPLLAIVAIISTFTYRRTNSYVPGALICSLFVSWYITAGQATQFAVS